MLTCDVACDVGKGVTGGYFQNGRNGKVLEGNTRTTFICPLRTPVGTVAALTTEEHYYEPSCISKAILRRHDECFDRRQNRGKCFCSANAHKLTSNQLGLGAIDKHKVGVSRELNGVCRCKTLVKSVNKAFSLINVS